MTILHRKVNGSTKSRKVVQLPEIFENSFSIYDFWEAEDLETYINAFHDFYKMNVNCSVL